MNLVPVLIVVVLGCAISCCDGKESNKYSKQANTPYKEMEKPFRMAKINMVWNKAVQRLSETKLGALHSELIFQDKEELQLKRLKSDGGDKDGLKEAELRKKLKGILNSFGLTDHFEGTKEADTKLPVRNDDNSVHKNLFKDKKLNRLWEKAEKTGFTEQELKTLKEEFFHHQERLEEYYGLLEKMGSSDKNEMQNELYLSEFEDLGMEVDPQDKKVNATMNELRSKHKDLKQGYDHLLKKATSGSLSPSFTEPRVQNLWKIANAADFSAEELSSLHSELLHYEKRLEKLHKLEGDFAVKNDINRHGNQEKDVSSFYEDKIKRHQRQVEKLHGDLESKIINRHVEL